MKDQKDKSAAAQFSVEHNVSISNDLKANVIELPEVNSLYYLKKKYFKQINPSVKLVNVLLHIYSECLII